MKDARMLTMLVVGLMVWLVPPIEAAPVGTAWTYQGRLIDANSTADGEYDFEFKLFNDPCTGIQQGSAINEDDVDVIDGYFTVELDFGAGVFDGDAIWLETAVRPGDSNDPNAFVTLSPRQEVAPTPYALYAASGPVPLELSGSVSYPRVVIKAINTGSGRGVYGEHNSSGNYGYLGDNRYGVYGRHNSSGNYGYLGDGSFGVFGSSSNFFGVYGKSSSGNYGYLGSNFYGVFGSDISRGNFGYLGNEDYGVYGEHELSGNYGYLGYYIHGVYGKHNSSGNYGYLGSKDYGVYGSSSDGCGVYGSSSMGYAGYFAGNVEITRTLTVDDTLTVKHMPYGDFRNVQWNDLSGKIGFDNSSKRFKENIRPIEDDFSKILSVRPKTYTRPGDPGRWEVGYIAEEFVEAGLEKLVWFEDEEHTIPDGINYEKIILYTNEIVKANRQEIQELKADRQAIQELKGQVAKLQAEKDALIAAQQTQIAELQEQLAQFKLQAMGH